MAKKEKNFWFYVFLALFAFILFYTMYFNKEKYHKESTKKFEKKTIDDMIQLSNDIDNYMKSRESLSDEKRKEKLVFLGMTAHHIDQMETKDQEINAIAKLIHNDVAHDLLRTQYIIDKIIEIQQSKIGQKIKYQALIKDIKDTPDKNFKPESKENLIKIIEDLM